MRISTGLGQATSSFETYPETQQLQEYHYSLPVKETHQSLITSNLISRPGKASTGFDSPRNLGSGGAYSEGAVAAAVAAAQYAHNHQQLQYPLTQSHYIKPGSSSFSNAPKNPAIDLPYAPAPKKSPKALLASKLQGLPAAQLQIHGGALKKPGQALHSLAELEGVTGYHRGHTPNALGHGYFNGYVPTMAYAGNGGHGSALGYAGNGGHGIGVGYAGNGGQGSAVGYAGSGAYVPGLAYGGNGVYGLTQMNPAYYGYYGQEMLGHGYENALHGLGFAGYNQLGPYAHDAPGLGNFGGNGRYSGLTNDVYGNTGYLLHQPYMQG